MPYRRFADSRGRTWRAWDVVPSPVDRRLALRRVRVTRPHQPERRGSRDRRVDIGRSRLFFSPSEASWLCFECDGERLRLRPVPADWALLGDDALEALRDEAAAEPARAPGR